MITIGKSYRFEAAHKLPLHDGKCRNLHGHSYKVEIMLIGDELIQEGPKTGMLLDFGQIDAQMQKVVAYLDHTYLNENEWLGVEHPTAEALAGRIGAYASEWLNTDRVRVDSVCVWETKKAWAAWTA